MKKIRVCVGILCIMMVISFFNTEYINAKDVNVEKKNEASIATTDEYYTTDGGHDVEITDNSIYVDGEEVNLNWSCTYNINYTRIQKFKITSSTTIDAATYQNGTFRDGQNMNRSSDCIRVKINNFNMSYFCNNPYDSWNKKFGENDWTYFYIDANTGKTIGTNANYYHTDLGLYNSFKPF